MRILDYKNVDIHKRLHKVGMSIIKEIEEYETIIFYAGDVKTKI